jgi:hypothetical protein
VAQANADQSLKNALRLVEVPRALGATDASEASKARMQATLADPAGRARVAAAIEHQAEHFDMPGLQLGFSYAPDAAPPDPRRFEPSGAAGHRLPHAWIGGEGARRSLLDEVPLDRFLLLAGPEGEAWLEAVRTLANPLLTSRRISTEELPGLGGWLEQAGIHASGALLVRPDQHVAWRAKSLRDVPSLAGALEQALR